MTKAIHGSFTIDRVYDASHNNRAYDGYTSKRLPVVFVWADTATGQVMA
jgi:hypothetical protein